MVKEFDLLIRPEHYFQEENLRLSIAKKLGIPIEDMGLIQVEKRSIDARSKEVSYQIRGKVYWGTLPKGPNEIYFPDSIADAKPVHIIGAGPAGLFAAIRLIQLGFKPIILERGKDIKKRRRDLALLNQKGIVNPESNYCFGEGGAGTYSDGKLYTRSGKRGSIETILQLFVHFGADPDILINTRPHIGTNRLPEIILKIREKIKELGGEIHFNQKLTRIDYQFHKVSGIFTEEGSYIKVDRLILATGHSARDVFQSLYESDIKILPKPFALGLRVEHSQSLIDKIQYHKDPRNEFLPPAYYQLKEQVQERGVFSFCMCPGGIIAPCSTDQSLIVVNGWSPSKRNNPYSNSGMVVQIELEDIQKNALGEDPFIALNFQEEIERKAAIAGGGNQVAPAQRLVDFVEGRFSSDLPKCSYIPGVKSTNLSEILPYWIFQKLKIAFPLFGKKMKGYFTNDAILVGVESRTSSPVRIPRDPISLEHPDIENLYPCGEGGGFAGGILSAAMDGFQVAETLSLKV